MAATPSEMVPLGTPAPPFDLADPSGKRVTLDDAYEGHRGLVVAFLSNHCPYVRLIAHRLGEVAARAEELGVATVGIMSNDVDAYPDDAPSLMAERAAEWGWAFPYLVDDTQQVAAAFRAACTPDFFVYGADRTLAYRGRFDAATPGNGEEVTGSDLAAAVEAVAEGRPVGDEQLSSIGCNIKWKPGGRPDLPG